MPWPLASHFSTIVQNPQIAFRDALLQSCRIERTGLNQPRVWAGQFAVVYKGIDEIGKAWAIRAFTSESADRRDRYEHISEFLKDRRLRCLVDFEYHDESIRSTDGRWYPLVTMDWVEGMTLFNWVDSKCRVGKGASIAKATQHWANLVGELAEAEIAHCDLSQVNVLVAPQGYLKLVDYDGMCVPALAGRPNLEIGVRPYQHPGRNGQTLLSSNLDNFSALLIYVALRALAADTSLWARHVTESGYEKLLFRSEDFADFQQSTLYHDLMISPDPGVRDLTDTLFSSAKGNLDDVPPLGRLIRPKTPFPSIASAADDAAPQMQPDAEREDEPDEATGRVVLEFISEGNDVTPFVIDHHEMVLIGRSEDCKLQITDDPRVSRHHCSLDVNPPHVRLRDLGGRNGTFVNGACYSTKSGPTAADDGAEKQNAEVDLKQGDRIMIGRTVIQVRIEN